MDFHSLKRDPAAIKAVLKNQDDGSIVVLKPCKIYIPKRYEDHRLAIISNEIRILAIYALVVDGTTYAVSKAIAMLQILPTATSIVDVDGEDYYEFSFDKGACFTPNRNLVMQDTLSYYVYDEVMAKGHIPAFLDYVDLGKLFDSSLYHSGFNIAANNIPLEMITASISRGEDKTKYYRHTDMKKPPAMIALRNVSLGATNTTARLNGAYFDEGLRSALVNPCETVEPIESALRA